MRSTLAACLVLLAAAPAHGAATGEVRAAYTAYVAGLDVMELRTSLALDAASYRISMTFATTGLVGAFLPGHQDSEVQGTWNGDRAAPQLFLGRGVWRGDPRETVIDYAAGQPVVRSLVPPNEAERDPIPAALAANTIDALSALALLMRQVGETGRCETRVTTFDGRRVVDVAARTAGMETLAATGRSSFAGPALRCDFDARQLAGFFRDADQARLRRPQSGSAWMAAVVAGGPMLPVRITFQTHWFGLATMYLTQAIPQ